MNEPHDPLGPSDDELDGLLAKLGNPAGATPRADAAHILGLALPAAPVALPAAAAGVSKWLAGAAVAAALAAGFVGGVVVTRATLDGERGTAGAPTGAGGAQAAAGASGAGGSGVADGGSAVVDGADGGSAVADGAVGGGAVADGAVGGGAVVEGAPNRGSAAPSAAGPIASGGPTRLADRPGVDAVARAARRSREGASARPYRDATQIPERAPAALGIAPLPDPKPLDLSAVGHEGQLPDSPIDPAPTAVARAPDETPLPDDLDAPRVATRRRSAASSTDRNPQAHGLARAEKRAARGAVASIEQASGPSPWSLALDGGVGWMEFPAQRSFAPLPVERVAAAGVLGGVAARVSTRGEGPIHVAGEVGLSILGGVAPVAGGVFFTPGGTVELGFHPTPTITPSLGWSVSGRMQVAGRRPELADAPPAFVVVTGPTLGLDVGARDRAHLRVRLDVDGAPAHLATDGLMPTVALTAGIEVPLGTW